MFNCAVSWPCKAEPLSLPATFSHLLTTNPLTSPHPPTPLSLTQSLHAAAELKPNEFNNGLRWHVAPSYSKQGGDDAAAAAQRAELKPFISCGQHLFCISVVFSVTPFTRSHLRRSSQQPWIKLWSITPGFLSMHEQEVVQSPSPMVMVGLGAKCKALQNVSGDRFQRCSDCFVWSSYTHELWVIENHPWTKSNLVHELTK